MYRKCPTGTVAISAWVDWSARRRLSRCAAAGVQQLHLFLQSQVLRSLFRWGKKREVKQNNGRSGFARSANVPFCSEPEKLLNAGWFVGAQNESAGPRPALQTLHLHCVTSLSIPALSKASSPPPDLPLQSPSEGSQMHGWTHGYTFKQARGDGISCVW